MEGQSRAREKTIIHTPCPNMEAVFEQEYEKGEVSGIFNYANMPAAVIAKLDNDIKIREAELPLDGENE